MICEVGPRDGLQNLKRVFSIEERARLIEMLAQSGAHRIEAVSFVNPARVPQMADAEAVLERLELDDDVHLAGLVMNERGANRALATRLNEIRTVIVASETFSRRNQNAGVDECIEAFALMAPTIRAEGRMLTGVVAASFGCPFEGRIEPQRVVDIVKALIESGADEIVLADTIGVGVPADVKRLAGLCRPHMAGKPLGFHFHNTRNTGYANAVAAIDAGANVLDASIGGLGGCPFAPAATGNISTDDLLYLMRGTGLDVPLSFEGLVEITQWLDERLPGELPGQLRKAGWFPTNSV